MTRDSSPPRRERCWLEEERWLKARDCPTGWGWQPPMDFYGFSFNEQQKRCFCDFHNNAKHANLWFIHDTAG